MFLGPRAPEGIDTDQDTELLDGNGDAVQKIFQAGKRPLRFTRPDNPFHHPGFQVFQIHKAQVDLPALNSVDHPGTVDTGDADGRPQHPGFMYIVFRPVKPSPIVQHSHHIFQGVVRPQEQALIALHRIRGGMSLGKRIARKAGHLMPDFRNEGFRISLFTTVRYKGRPDPFEFIPGAKLPAHPPSEHVGLPQAEARKIVGDLDHVFLIDHNPIGLRHDLQQHRVGFFDALRVAVAQDVFPHHPAFCHPGPDDGTGGHQPQVVIYFQFAQKHAHSRGFHIEAPHTLGGFYHPVDVRVLLDPGNVVDVNPFKSLRLVFPDDLQGLLDLGKAPLAQDIEFVEAHVLGDHHIELGGGKPLGGQVGSRKPVDRFVADQDTPGVHAQVIRHPPYEFPVTQHQAGHLIEAGGGIPPFAQLVDLCLGQPENLAQFPDDPPLLEGNIGAEEGDVVEPFKNVFGDGLPVFPGKVDIEIRGVGPEQVDKPLEIQIELYGVHIGNAQQVGHDAVCPAATAHIEKPPPTGLAHDIPVDQEIRDKPLLSDQLQLLLQAGIDLRARVAIAIGHAFPAEPLEQRFIRIPPAGIRPQVLGLSVLGKIEPDLALLHKPFRIFQDKLHPGKGSRQVLERVHLVFRARLFGFGKPAEQHVVIDGPEQAVGIEIPLAAKSHRLQDHQTVPVLSHPGKGKAAQVPKGNPYKLTGGKFRHLIQQNLFKRVDHIGTGKSGGPARKWCFFMQVAGEVAVQFKIALVVTGNPDKTRVDPVSEIDSQQGPDLKFRRPPHKIQPGRSVVDIGQGQAGHPAIPGEPEQFHLGKGPVAEAVVSMTIEVHNGYVFNL